MEGLHWFTQHWLDLLQSLGIVAGLFFTGVSMRREGKSRRTQNLLSITKHHREIWSEVLNRPELGRVLQQSPDLSVDPIKEHENLFVRFLILHLNTTFWAVTNQMLLKPDALEKDVKTFFSLPIPRAVWKEWRQFQDEEFIHFVEKALK